MTKPHDSRSDFGVGRSVACLEGIPAPEAAVVNQTTPCFGPDGRSSSRRRPSDLRAPLA